MITYQFYGICSQHFTISPPRWTAASANWARKRSATNVMKWEMITVAAPMYWSNSAAAVESNAGIILKLPQQLRWPWCNYQCTIGLWHYQHHKSYILSWFLPWPKINKIFLSFGMVSFIPLDLPMAAYRLHCSSR